ncbi:4525_t:CDS:2 [Paraglomus occultum]|uniref:4525_t:CDS:1 n=1 Tax=Paraglomus occultum TaxID=144539 RepID=A0A9N9GS74_9GLOM|nr:4525_t:CDS:2 [Paraglomus occultum]
MLGRHCQKVNLSWCQYINSQGIEALVDGFTMLKINGLPKLNETALAKIGMLKNLRALSLDACPTLTGSHITALLRGDSQYPEHDPPPLTHLNLSTTTISPTCSSLAEEGSYPFISEMYKNRSTRSGRRSLYHRPHTTFFRIKPPNLKLCCERITDEGVIDLFRSCPYLSHIDLDHCQRKRNRNVQEERFGCRNITVSAVKDAIPKVSGAGVILKSKATTLGRLAMPTTRKRIAGRMQMDKRGLPEDC